MVSPGTTEKSQTATVYKVAADFNNGGKPRLFHAQATVGHDKVKVEVARDWDKVTVQTLDKAEVAFSPQEAVRRYLVQRRNEIMGIERQMDAARALLEPAANEGTSNE